MPIKQLFLFFLFIPICSIAQCPDEIILVQQNEIDDLVDLFPSCISFLEVKIVGSEIKNLEGLSHLENIDFLFIENTEIESLAGIQGLELSEYISIENNDNLTDLDHFPSIQLDTSIEINIKQNQVLENTEGLLNLTAGLDLLIRIENNDNLNDVSIGKSSQLTTYIKNNANLLTVGIDEIQESLQTIEIHENPSLVSINGLNNVDAENKTVATISIVDCELLQNLPTFNGVKTINYLIIENTGIQQLSGFYDLNKIEWLLSISHNQELKDIYQFCRNVFACEYLYIRNNFELNYIADFLDGPAAFVKKDMSILSNPNLISFDSKAVCRSLEIMDLLEGDILINDNGEPYNDIDGFIDFCENLTVDVAFLNSFFDKNENGILDDDEYNIKAGHLILSEGYIGEFYDQGIYYFDDFGRPDTLVFEPDECWEITTNNAVVPVDENLNVGDTIFYGLSPSCLIDSVDLSIVSDQLICNDEVQFYIKITNTGTTDVENLLINFQFDGNFISSTAEIINELDNIVQFESGRLEIYESKTFIITLQTPDENFTGQILTYTTHCIHPNNNKSYTSSLEQELLCSYDPNDISVSPYGLKSAHLTPKKVPLIYTVRFQNTGNFPAENVEIVTLLDTNFNQHSFKIHQASHPITNIKTSSNLCVFKFEDINLPDSMANEQESHGFVQFSLMPNENVQDSSRIENFAQIYFDENSAIVTNTVFNTLVDSIPSVCCPSSFNLTSQEAVIDMAYKYKTCQYIPTDLVIESTQVNDLSHLKYIKEIAGDLIIQGTDINTMSGLDSLVKITGNLIIKSNDSLQDPESFPMLESVGGHISILKNNSLQNNTEFSALGSIGESYILSQNENLIYFNGPPLIDSIYGSLIISNNTSLEEISGFENLSSCDTLIIKKNEKFTTFNSLPFFVIQDSLGIFQNDQLTICNHQTICDFILLKPERSFINNNDDQCFSLNEVTQSCISATQENTISNKVLIKPNPFNAQVSIAENYTLKQVLNMIGESVPFNSFNDNNYAIENETKGLYMFIIQGKNGEITVEKAIKL